ncbi:TlyA family RNA methyltransferase [Synechococcus sp. PCC 7336]|uniref:TlyA family RNA methyltransferase n=1 Tax=Synechococcus sp. PCC 7336 TaxID=195250 RepID=UPI00034AC9B8|nr:TlyA family RNA methyltransferase [Synechococcus sp. PCC 7336]
MPRQRLDVWLVDRGYFESRQQAQRAVLAGEVFVDDRTIDKPGTAIADDAVVRVKAKPKYVSRGGDKLAGALQTFDLDIRDRICLDGGISTGGFTDCLLKHGAREVYGIDVGYGQVAWSLQTDDRVHLRERTNLRHLKPEELYPADLPPECWPTLAVVDVSFISLTKVLPALWNLLRSPKEALLLVKPQFEAGRDRVGKKGVVRNPQVQAEAIASVLAAARALGWHYWGVTWSSAPGPAGNLEFLLWLQDRSGPDEPALSHLQALAREARLALADTARR